MGGMWRVLSALVVVAAVNPVWADGCLEYKKNADVNVNLIKTVTQVTQDDGLDDMWHGLVETAWVNEFDIGFFVSPVPGGVCVGIDSVDMNAGYDKFNVKIDVRHKPESCSYNAVLAHENKHINVYNEVAKEFFPELKKSVENAAGAVFPIFVKTYDEVKNASAQLKEKFLEHPDFVLIQQKIEAAQEIRNKRVDQNETGQDLKNCLI